VLDRADTIHMLVARLARRHDLPPIRLLLLERERGEQLDRQLLGTDLSDRGWVEGTRYAEAPLVVPNLSADDIWLLVEHCPWRTDGAQLKTPRDEFFGRLDRLDIQRRALVAMILADALAASPNRDDLGGLAAVLTDLLLRERNHQWPPELRDRDRKLREAEAVIAFATMVDGLRPQDLPAIDKARGAAPFDRQIMPLCAQAIGKPLNNRQPVLGRLEPDLIGEFFVLEVLHDPNNSFAETPHPWMPEAAWRMRGSAMAGFVIRARQNFPDHPSIKQLAITVEGVEESWQLEAIDALSRASDPVQALAQVRETLVRAAYSDPRGAGMALAHWTARVTSFHDLEASLPIAYLSALATLCLVHKDAPDLRRSWEGNIKRFLDGRANCWAMLANLRELAERHEAAAAWELWATAAVNLIRVDAVLAQTVSDPPPGAIGTGDAPRSTTSPGDDTLYGRRSADPRIRSLLGEMRMVAARLDHAAVWALWAQAAYNLADDLRLRDPAAARALRADMLEVAHKRNEPLLWHLYDKTYAVVDVLPADQVPCEDEFDLPFPSVLPDSGIEVEVLLGTVGDWQKVKRQKKSGGWRVRKITRRDYANPSVSFLPVPQSSRSDPLTAPDPGDWLTSAKIGRNALCPCGSGKKYKRCHGSPGME
jgi:hypothetical protein